MIALLLALGPRPCLPAELGKIDPPSAIEAQAAPAAPAPPPVRPAPPLAPALTRQERTQYRIAFGILGQLGALDITLTPGARASDVVTLLGQVKASVFGIGETEKRIVSEFDPASLEARRWTSLRLTGGKSVTDFARQPRPGTVSLVRRRPGKPDQPETLVRKVAVLDPLGFVLRMRVSPPRTSQVFEVLDGHGLWLLTIAPAVADAGDFGRALRLDGKAEPIFWDGSHDDDRPNRTFSFWLSDDEFHTPVRLVMPLSVGEVRADLVTVTRSHPRAATAEAALPAPARLQTVDRLLPRSLFGWLTPAKRPQ
jgi:hypothetical protein